MNYFFKKTKGFIAIKNLDKPKNFNKTLLGETECLPNPYFSFTGCLGIQYPNTVS